MELKFPELSEDRLQRIRAGEELPPKPDFISQEEWDGLLAFRNPQLVRDEGRKHAQAYIARQEGADEMAGAPVIVLTTIGRKTGNEVSTSLNYMKDGDSWLVCGSFFGMHETPHWVRNLEKNPRGWVQDRDDKFEVEAEKLTGAAREEVWPKLVDSFPLWGWFQYFAPREFQVFRLTPMS